MPVEARPSCSSRIALPERIRPLYAFESHFLDLGGICLHYLDEGLGEPVLLLHGNPSWSFMYRDLIRALRTDRRVIAPDHVGCGLSSRPSEERYTYTLSRRLADLETLIDSLDLPGPLSLVLHDWGGLIGMAFAVRHPERIARIVLLNTAGFRVPDGGSLHWTIRFCRRSRIGAFLMTYFNAFARGACRLGSARGMSAAVRGGYLAPYRSVRDRLAVTRFVQDIPLQCGDPAFEIVDETERGLGRLRDRRLMICWGDRDFVFNEAFLMKWLDYFPDADVHRFSEAGHYVLEDAADDLIPLIKEFLRDGPSGSERVA
ncbi:MAG: alpha/beta fold hydrolase [Acidobacteriota bacterium]